MFIRDFIHVARPFEQVAPRFVHDTAWLAPLAADAAEVARDLAVSLLGHDQAPLARRGPVRCEIGPVRARATSLLVPLWLLSEGPDNVLPDLAGDLEVAPVGTGRSLLAFGATYRRPAQESRELQRVERATEVGVRTFLSGIADALNQIAPRQ